jgi:hypothetical protein
MRVADEGDLLLSASQGKDRIQVSPVRSVCSIELTSRRIVMNLLDVHGRIVASGQTPTIMITDDHKTSGSKTTGTTTEHSASSLVRKKPREPSASTEDERRRAGRKPYDRKSASIGERPTGMASPRSTYPYGLSMTPLQGSIPGSPAPERNYFSLPVPGVQPGSGAVSPSLLMANGHGPEPDRLGRRKQLASPNAIRTLSRSTYRACSGHATRRRAAASCDNNGRGRCMGVRFE